MRVLVFEHRELPRDCSKLLYESKILMLSQYQDNIMYIGYPAGNS